MKIDINKIKVMEDNPRKISGFDFENLKESIKEFGFLEPLIVNQDNILIGGHQRLKALKELGYNEIDVVQVELDKEKLRKLNLALNRIGGDWDYDKLNDFIKDMDYGKIDFFLESEIKQIKENYDFDDLSKEMENLKTEEEKTAVWSAKFKDKETLNGVEGLIQKIKKKEKLGRFSSDYVNGKILEILCENYGKEHSIS